MEPADYDRFPTWQDDARVRKWNLWGYVDAPGRRGGLPPRPLEGSTTGAEVCILAAADTVMDRDSADLASPRCSPTSRSSGRSWAARASSRSAMPASSWAIARHAWKDPR